MALGQSIPWAASDFWSAFYNSTNEYLISVNNLQNSSKHGIRTFSGGKMKFLILASVIVFGSASSFAAESIGLLQIKSVKQSQPSDGKIQVEVISLLPCGIEYLGLLKRGVGPYSLSSPRFEVRSIGKDTGKKCLAADQAVTDTFELDAIAGKNTLISIQP